LLVLEEALPRLISVLAYPFLGHGAVRAGEYWQIVLGPLLLLIVLYARGGVDGLLLGARRA
jgi:branched-chain amino acid transport system permease protein